MFIRSSVPRLKVIGDDWKNIFNFSLCLLGSEAQKKMSFD
jgi:hypothetical protein